MDTVINLVALNIEKNAFGEDVEEETLMPVFASIENVGRAEFFKASELALAPQFTARTAAINYSGQRILELDGQRFGIYRTFLDGDDIELYCEKKAGLDNGDGTGGSACG